MNAPYDDVLDPLRRAYDARAAWRDGLTKDPRKRAERQAFRDRLTPGARLLEVGAGTRGAPTSICSPSPPPHSSTSWTSTSSTPVAATGSSP